MKICCIADTQLDKQNIEKYLRAFRSYIDKADYIIHLGDGIENSLHFLSAYKNVVFIKGNHDSDNTLYKESFTIDIKGLNLLFLHGSRDNKIIEQLDIWKNKFRFKRELDIDLSGYYTWLSNKYNNYDIIVYGHIHIPRIKVRNNTCYFCPGGIIEDRLLFGHYRSIGYITIGENKKVADIDVIKYDEDSKKSYISAHKEFLW